MTLQPNGQSRATATPGPAVRGAAPGGPGATGQRPRTDPWPGQAPQSRPRQPVQQPVPPQQAAPSYPAAPQPQRAAHPQHPHAQQQRAPQQQAAGRPGAASATRAGTGRRWLGVLAFAVLAGLSLPVHVLALFFAFVEFASPGEPSTAILLVLGAFVGSFAALLVTATVSQLIGGFPSRWRVRITFAVTNAVLALAVALVASLTLF